VQSVIDGLRAGAATQVELTNYTADGTPFRNLLSLQPVHDSNGVYRYCIGVLADAATISDAQRVALERLRRLLPAHFEEELEPLHPHKPKDDGKESYI